MKSVSSDEKNEFPFTWDIWISDRDNNVQKLSEQIATIKGFWDLFDTEYPVAAIPQGVTLFLMKQGIPPQWESEENRNGVELSWFVNGKDKTKATESTGSTPSERRATPISQANTYFVSSAALSDVAKHVWMYACIGAIGGLFDLRFKGVNMICGVSVAHKENNTFLISIWLKNREPLFSIADWMNELIKKQERLHENSSETKKHISISGGIVRDHRKLIGKFIKSQTLSMHNN